MSDLIDRQKALDALGEEPVGVTDWDLGCRNQWEWDTEILRTMPSAEPKRKTGHWIDTDNYYQRWKCSECGCHTRDAEPKYCPNCGAKME